METRTSRDITWTQTPERITVALIPKAGSDLRQLQSRTSLSKTDLANRAITLYEFVDAQLRAGRDLVIRDPVTGETQLVRLLWDQPRTACGPRPATAGATAMPGQATRPQPAAASLRSDGSESVSGLSTAKYCF